MRVATGFSGVVDPVHVWMCFVGTWEILVAAQGRVLSRKVQEPTLDGQAVRKSDKAIVVMKRVNKDVVMALAESVERRALAERKIGDHPVVRTQCLAKSEVERAVCATRHYDPVCQELGCSFRIRVSWVDVRLDAGAGCVSSASPDLCGLRLVSA